MSEPLDIAALENELGRLELERDALEKRIAETNMLLKSLSERLNEVKGNPWRRDSGLIETTGQRLQQARAKARHRRLLPQIRIIRGETTEVRLLALVGPKQIRVLDSDETDRYTAFDREGDARHEFYGKIHPEDLARILSGELKPSREGS